MREILFRAKNFDNGVWVQGYYVRLNGNKHFIYTGQSDVDCGNYYPDYYPVAAKTVGQFTGLTDKNGTKIFEGDILKVDNGKRNSIVTVKFGCFRPEMFYEAYESISCRKLKGNAFGLYGEAFNRTKNRTEQLLIINNTHYIEVIGNIHDNPELLKGGADNG